MLFLSYRTRLVIYSLLLMVFLSGTLIYSYQYAQNYILKEADNHMVRMKQLLDGHLNAERNALQRYATIASRDLGLKEYMFVVTGIGGDTDALENLYNRQFGWLPIDRKLILDSNNKILVGKQHTDLAIAVSQHENKTRKNEFYFHGKTGLELVAFAPILYREQLLGRVAVTLQLNQDWLETNKRITGGEFFLIHNNEVINSTLESNTQLQINRAKQRLISNGNEYHTYPIKLPGKLKQSLELWFGLSAHEITAQINQHKQFTLTLSAFGITAILVMALVIIRNFSRPLTQLIGAMRKVEEGSLPSIPQKKPRNEFDELSNHFADMLDALREKQIEVDKTHKQLEHSAITDTLTGLYNRRYLQEVFPKLLASAKRDKHHVFGVLMDLDYFKKINDTHGHIVGDECLKHFAHKLQQGSRTSDYIFRLGGEEFLILTVSENIMSASNFADKLRNTIESSPCRVGDQLISYTVSGGVSYAHPEGLPDAALQQLISRADIALYQAKQAGRNRICTSTTEQDKNSSDRIQQQ